MPECGAAPGFVSGFVSLVGLPNAGKSTLLNALLGAKVAIVSEKPQTTRTLIQGVATTERAQIVFLDTPGIHKPDSLFNRRMMETIRPALAERDLLLYVVDATREPGEADLEGVELVRRSGTPTLLVLNKIDRVKPKERLLPLVERYKSRHEFADYLPVSALTGEGVEAVLAATMARLPEGPAYYPSDYLTDQPERFLAAELIRERLLEETRGEVPHSIAVLVERWEEKDGLARISATIYVEREGQKGIAIGAGGSMLKRVGTRARGEMEAMFGRKVFLELHVKVRPRWRENPQFLNELDWRWTMGGGEAGGEGQPGTA
ncbi:MAG: GTPase Era [Bryobacteraceae bacterium]|jgi:GTP-binding protein Era